MCLFWSKRPTFRRSRTAMLPNLVFAAIVGYGTGNYIFKENVKEYWEEQNALQQQATQNSASNGGDGPPSGGKDEK